MLSCFFAMANTIFSKEREERGREGKTRVQCSSVSDREHAPHHCDRGGEVQQTPLERQHSVQFGHRMHHPKRG
jgi:hypothetical protein